MITIVMRGGAGAYDLKDYVQRPELTRLFLGMYSVALAVGTRIMRCRPGIGTSAG